MKKRTISLLALLLACLMIITACGKKPTQGNKPDDSEQQQGSSGNTGSDLPGGSGTGSGDQPGGSSGSGGGTGTSNDQNIKIGEVNGGSILA